MINNKKILGIIPARGGSKRIPRKNIRNLAGKPLIAWTIEEAKKSRYIDRCIVSTDDDGIIDIAKAWGGDVPFKRPVELAQDDTPSIALVLDAMNRFPEYEYIVLLQVTSPLRVVGDIDGCIEFCLFQQAESCVSVTEAEISPYWMLTMDLDSMIKPLINISHSKVYQRQKLPKVYQYNGAIYIASRAYIEKNQDLIGPGTLGYLMPNERSYDIDSIYDFLMVEMIKTKNDRGIFGENNKISK